MHVMHIFLSLENEKLVQDLFSVEELEAVISRDDDDINLEVFFLIGTFTYLNIKKFTINR